MRYIDHKKIYELTENGLTIFQYYFPGIDFNDIKHNVKDRQDEKTASARVNWHEGLWRITDFGNQDVVNGMPGIEYVRHRENISYYDSLCFVETVIIKHEIGDGKFKSKEFRPDYEYREMTPEDKKGEYKFTYKEKPDKSDLENIGRYVDEDTLTYFNCRCVEKYSYCGPSKKLNKDVVHIFKSNKDYPIYVFDYGDFKKIYRPHELEKKNRFAYEGQKPKNYIYGLKQLKECKNEYINNEDDDENPITPPKDKPEAKIKDVFRCSGESDALNLHSLGFHVYWLNSESMDLKYEQYKEIDDLCENHFMIMDLDTTGMAQAVKNALKYIDLYNVILPDWLSQKKDWRGNPCKDLKDFINLSGEDRDATKYNFLVLKSKARRVKFWTKVIDEKKTKSTYNLNIEHFYFFLKCNGFYKMETGYMKNSDYCYARIKGKVVELIHPDNIQDVVKRFTKEWIDSKNRMDTMDLLNKINTSNQIVESNIKGIHEIKLNFKNYDRNTEYIHFKNGSLKITPDKIERVDHDQLPNFILGQIKVNKKPITHLINKDIRVIKQPAIELKLSAKHQELKDKLESTTDYDEKYKINLEIMDLPEIDKYEVVINDDSFVFVKFLQDLSRIYWRKELEDGKELTVTEKKEQNLCLANLLFVLGYNCQQYKEENKAYMTYLQDMKIGEVGKSEGRSGKSVTSKAISFVRSTFEIPGRKLDNTKAYEFIYDGRTEFHSFTYIDDYSEYGDIQNLYNEITGVTKINPKNYSAVTLEFEDSGKILINSNFPLRNLDTSTLARIVNTGVSDYYHVKSTYNNYKETRNPFLKYGKTLYKDFSPEEWVQFYNLMAYCIQIAQKFDKIDPPMGKLDKIQARNIMSQGLGKDEDFLHWANGYFINPEENVLLPNVSPFDKGYLNSFIVKETAFKSFQETLTSKQKSDYRITKFKKHVKAWCDYKEYEFNPIDYCYGEGAEKLENRRINKSIDGKTVECFYISTIKQVEAAESVPMNIDLLDETLPF